MSIVGKYIQAELNVSEVIFDHNVDKYKNFKVRPNYKSLRPLLEKLYGDPNKDKKKNEG